MDKTVKTEKKVNGLRFNDVVVNLNTGEKFMFLNPKKDNHVKVATIIGWKKATDKLVEAIQENPTNISAKVASYVEREDARIFSREFLVTEKAYNEKINTPETKKLVSTISETEKQIATLTKQLTSDRKRLVTTINQ